jgi:Tfp pilus assembly PilM family ATPase
MANRVLGIEYAGEQIKIVEVGFGRRLKIFNFAVVDNRKVDPARRTEQLNHALQVRGFEARDAIVATAGGTTEHRLLTLPPLSTREMLFVMQREAKKLAPTGMAELLWSYDVLKAKEELGIKKNQILLVTAERPMIDAAQNLMAHSRVKLQQVTTIPEAVLNLLRQVTGDWKKDAVRTVVHFAGADAYIMFMQDGTLLLSREIHFDSADMAQEEQADRLSNELRRSMLYFRQNFPQAQLNQIVFSGDNDILGALATRSSEELGVRGSILRFEDNLDTSGFRGNWDEFRFHLPSLTAALGAAWRKTPGISGVNLLPGKTQARQEAGINPTKIARAACIVAASITLTVGGLYVRERGTMDASRRELTQRAAVIEPKLQQMVQFEASRSLAEKRAAFLKTMESRTDWTEIFRDISFLIPSTGVFEEMRIEGGDAPKITIRGYVLASSAAEGNGDFNRFFAALGGLPSFKTVSMPKPTVVSVADSGPPGQLKAADLTTQASKVSFEVVCELQ